MNMRYFASLIIIFCGSFFSDSVNAERTAEEIEAQFSQDLLEFNKQRLVIISQSMQFTPKQAADFWAVYEKYSGEMKAIQDEGAALLNDYFSDIKSQVTDETAVELNLRSFDITERKVEIRRKYFPRFSAATNDSMAARFMQIDGMVDAAIELLIVQSLPAFPTEFSKLMDSSIGDRANRF